MFFYVNVLSRVDVYEVGKDWEFVCLRGLYGFLGVKNFLD